MNPLQSRLAALRRRIRFISLLRGIGLLIVALFGTSLVAGFLDWRFELPSSLRAIFLVLTLGATIVVGYRFLIYPLSKRMNDLALALRIEAQYPILNDALASTVEFLQTAPDAPTAGSLAMRREAIQRSLRLAQGCNFEKVIDRRGLRTSLVSAFAVCALLAFLWLTSPSVVSSAFLRFVHPFGEHEWETSTLLTLVDFHDRVAIGQPYQIKGQVSRKIPKEAYIEFVDLASTVERREYPINVSEDGTYGTFSAKIDMSRQFRDFRFRVLAGDARSPRREGRWHTVHVLQPPRLTGLDGLPSPQIELFPPAYTGLPSPQKLSPGSGDIDAVAGTMVVLRAATDRPIIKAWIEYRPAEPAVIVSAYLGTLGSTNAVQCSSLHAAGREVWGKSCMIEGECSQFTMTFTPFISGMYVLRLRDADGLEKDYEYQVNITPDPAPEVNLVQPATSRNVLPNAEISLRVSASDALFGLRNAFVEYWKSNPDRKSNTPPTRIPLFDHREQTQSLGQATAALVGSPLVLMHPMDQLQTKQVNADRRWSLAGWVKEGDTLIVRAGATDFNDVVAFNRPAYSHQVELRVVNLAQLEIELDADQEKLQQGLLQLREWQEDALKSVLEAEKQWRETGKIRDQDAMELQRAEQLQRQILARIGNDKDEGLRKDLAHLQEVLRDNKITSSGTKDRIDLLKKELDRLAQEHLQMIEPQVANARRKLTNLKDAKAPDKNTKGELGEARQHQEEVKDSLDELLKHLERWSKSEEVRGEARAIQQEQRKIQEKTQALAESFDPNSAEWKAALQRAAALQQRLGEKAQRLLDKMERMAQQRSEKEPDIAKLLEKSAEIGRQDNLPGNMFDIDLQMQRQDLGRALKQQDESIATLDKMISAMRESREDELERLIKKQKQAEEELKQLGEDLEKLQKKVKEAEKIEDPAEREAALKKLADEQRKMEEATREKARELARLRADEANRELRDAADMMEKAAQQLEEGSNPEDAQQDAQEKVQRAQEELRQSRERTEEELAREQIHRIADEINGLKTRQDAMIAETQRIHEEVLRGGWKRELLISLLTHKENQEGLAAETERIAEKVKGANVFSTLLEKAAENMRDAAAMLENRKKVGFSREDVFPFTKEMLDEEENTQERTLRLQQQASGRLERLTASLKPLLEKQLAKQEDGQPGGGEGGGGGENEPQGGIKAQDGIPAIAQLRALRAEQEDVHLRTKAFALRHPDTADLTPDQEGELSNIQADQEAVAALFRELATEGSKGGKQ